MAQNESTAAPVNREVIVVGPVAVAIVFLAGCRSHGEEGVGQRSRTAERMYQRHIVTAAAGALEVSKQARVRSCREVRPSLDTYGTTNYYFCDVNEPAGRTAMCLFIYRDRVSELGLRDLEKCEAEVND